MTVPQNGVAALEGGPVDIPAHLAYLAARYVEQGGRSNATSKRSSKPEYSGRSVRSHTREDPSLTACHRILGRVMQLVLRLRPVTAVLISPLLMMLMMLVGSGEAASREKKFFSAELVPQLGHSDRVESVSYSPIGGRIVTGSADNTVRIWDADTGDVVATITGHEHAILSVSYSPDGSHIASGSRDGTMRLWNAETGHAVKIIRTRGAVMSVAYSPDGHRIATGSTDGTVRVWSALTHKSVTTIKGHVGAVTSVVYRPDGHRIATGSADGTVRIWDALTYREVATIKGHTDAITSIV